MFVSRSSLEKPRPFERWVRTTSPSRYSTLWSFFSSSAPTSSAIVDLPAPESPVNQSVNPLAIRLLSPSGTWSRAMSGDLVPGHGRGPGPAGQRVGVDAALELVRTGPAAGALLLVGRSRAGARDAADRAIPGLVQRVERNLVDLDVGPDALLVPVGERVELPDPVTLRPLELRRSGAARRLIAADAGDPGVVGAERFEQRLNLADMAAAVRIRFPEVRTLALVLLGHRDHLRALELEPVALHQTVPRLVALAAEKLRVELDHGDPEAELRDHVHEHRRLLLPGAGQAELVAVLLVAPAEQVFGGHRLEVELRQSGCDRHRAAPPLACRRAIQGGGFPAGSLRRAGCFRGSPRGRNA